jgi:hypothetical protein
MIQIDHAVDGVPQIASCPICGDKWERPDDDPQGETLELWVRWHRRPYQWEAKLKDWRVDQYSRTLEEQ